MDKTSVESKVAASKCEVDNLKRVLFDLKTQNGRLAEELAHAEKDLCILKTNFAKSKRRSEKAQDGVSAALPVKLQMFMEDLGNRKSEKTHRNLAEKQLRKIEAQQDAWASESLLGKKSTQRTSKGILSLDDTTEPETLSSDKSHTSSMESNLHGWTSR